ncbi:MAG: UDP-glucose 4-epimerase GalE, partial [Anaerovorax sp.]
MNQINKNPAILITGGAGYIGSHTCVQLLLANENVIIADNLINSNPKVLNRIKEITKKDFKFYPIDLCDEEKVRELFENNAIKSVIHFAGLKAVGESTAFPLKYYDNNLKCTLTLLKMMERFHVKKLVFSSSATVYGDPLTVPITEDFPLSVTNPYGSTKLIIENILKDVYKADPTWQIAILRYFNPIGAHESGLIGEDPNGIPNNLLPYISQVAVGKMSHLNVFGNDY